MHFGKTTDLIPDLVEPIKAYRLWHVTPYVGVQYPRTLRALWGTSDWTPGVQTARCNGYAETELGLYHLSKAIESGLLPIDSFGDHCAEAPCAPELSGFHNGFGCGIYAYKSVWDVALEWTTSSNHNNTLVFGEVLLWGNTYEHEHGYRAQYAEIVRLFYGTQSQMVPAEWKTLRDQYRVRLDNFIHFLLNEIDPDDSEVTPQTRDKIVERMAHSAFAELYHKLTDRPRVAKADWHKTVMKFEHWCKGESSG
jgi:hypothetical protein